MSAAQSLYQVRETAGSPGRNWRENPLNEILKDRSSSTTIFSDSKKDVPTYFLDGVWKPQFTPEVGRHRPYGEANLVSSQVVAEWHGQVVSINDAFFVAELRGTIGAGISGALEEAQIPIDEIRPDDLELLSPGSFFRLCVNMENRGGTKRRYTDIVFRRMPAYRREELDDARQVAIQIARAIRVD